VDKWHPIMAAVEGPVGIWQLIDPAGKVYGRVELRRVSDGSEVRYKAVWGGELLGWSTTLRRACEAVHMAYVRSHTAPPFQGYPKYSR
jgi:hypothetical protein